MEEYKIENIMLIRIFIGFRKEMKKYNKKS